MIRSIIDRLGADESLIHLPSCFSLQDSSALRVDLSWIAHDKRHRPIAWRAYFCGRSWKSLSGMPRRRRRLVGYLLLPFIVGENGSAERDHRNYQDKYALVEQIFEEAMSALLAAVGDLGREHPSEVWVTFFEHIAEYERLYRALLGKKGSPWFVWKMRAALAGLLKERGQLPHGPNYSGLPIHSFSDTFVPDLVSALFVEAITWWLEQGKPYTPREIATRSALLAQAVFKEASAWR